MKKVWFDCENPSISRLIFRANGLKDPAFSGPGIPGQCRGNNQANLIITYKL